MTWKPRGSALGSYLACPWRAANDRAIAEGRISSEEAKQIGLWEETGYAPHGSVIHWVTQTGLPCIFPPREPTDVEVAEVAEHWGGDSAQAREAFRRGDPLAYKPTQAEFALARTLFRGSALAQEDATAKAAQTLASHLPLASDGQPWQAETAWETEYCTGHIDLLSHHLLDLGDIKTTSKPPELAEVSCKPEYLAQLVIYGRMVRDVKGVQPRNAFIQYVDSMRGMWAYRVPMDLTTPAMLGYADQLEAFCRFLMSDALWAYAWPNISAHCEKSWCPYRPSCKGVIMPPKGSFYDGRASMRPLGVKMPSLQLGQRA